MRVYQIGKAKKFPRDVQMTVTTKNMSGPSFTIKQWVKEHWIYVSLNLTEAIRLKNALELAIAEATEMNLADYYLTGTDRDPDLQPLPEDDQVGSD